MIRSFGHCKEAITHTFGMSKGNRNSVGAKSPVTPCQAEEPGITEVFDLVARTVSKPKKARFPDGSLSRGNLHASGSIC
jgi:hypothetical protein